MNGPAAAYLWTRCMFFLTSPDPIPTRREVTIRLVPVGHLSSDTSYSPAQRAQRHVHDQSSTSNKTYGASPKNDRIRASSTASYSML